MKTTMKSAMKAAALLLMATVMTAGMTSCSSDDDNSTVTDTNVAGTIITITPTLPDDCVNTYDNTLIYTDGTGTKHTAELVNGKDITIKSSTPESTGTLTIHQTVKSGVKLTEASYMIGSELTFVVQGVNAKGQVVCKSDPKKANLMYTYRASELVEILAKDPMKAQYKVTKTTDAENPLLFLVEQIVEKK